MAADGSPTNRRPQRCPTTVVKEVDVKVLEFKCMDSSMLSTLGKHCKLTSWKISVGGADVEIQLHVDKSVTGKCEVGVVWAGKQVFPGLDSKGRHSDKGQLKEDFLYKHPFRGTVKDLKREKAFEVKVEGKDVWLPATLKEQTNEHFKVLVYTSSDPERCVEWPLVTKDIIRDKKHRPLVIPERTLLLTVPKAEPLKATLTIDSGTDLTHFLVRDTPPRSGKARVELKANKHRTHVEAVGAVCVDGETLHRFLTGTVFQVDERTEKHRHIWDVKLGPFADHTIVLARQARIGGFSTNVFEVSVDGTLLVMAQPQDLHMDEDGSKFICEFKFVGPRSLIWHVHETDRETERDLDTTGTVEQVSQAEYRVFLECGINEATLEGAALHISDCEGKNFRAFQDLPVMKEPSKVHLSCEASAMKESFRLVVPKKYHDASAPVQEEEEEELPFIEMVKKFIENPASLLQSCGTTVAQYTGQDACGVAAPDGAAPPPTRAPAAGSPR